MADDPDDPELVQLRALNARIEALHAQRWDADGREDPAVVIAIDALDTEAAALIRARCDRTLAPIIAATDAAIAEAHRLLGCPPPGIEPPYATTWERRVKVRPEPGAPGTSEPPPEPSPRAKALTEAFTRATREAVAEHPPAGAQAVTSASQSGGLNEQKSVPLTDTELSRRAAPGH